MKASGWVKSIFVFGVVGLGATGAWKYYRGGQETTYQTTPLDRGSISSTIQTSGSCEAVTTVMVGSQVSGNIKKIHVDYNSEVTQGQLLAEIEPDTFQSKVDSARANLESSHANVINSQASMRGAEADLASSRANLESQKANAVKARVSMQDAKSKLDHENELFKRGIVSQEERDTAQATYESSQASVQAAEAQIKASESSVKASESQIEVAKTKLTQSQAQERVTSATLAQAKIDLEHTQIVSPVSGTVIARKMDEGQTVAASFSAPEIFQIAKDLTKMQVIADVDEADIGMVKEGMGVTFTVAAYQNEVFHGSVTQIRREPVTTQNVVTYSAVIEVNNEDLKLFPGMTATITFLVERRDNVLRVPAAALRVRIEDTTKPADAATSTTRGGDSGAGRGGAGRGSGGAGGRGGGPGGGGRDASGRGGRRGGAPPTASLWVLGADGKPREVKFVPGISDSNYYEVREIRSGELKEGDPVITSVISPKTATTTATTPFGGPGGRGGRRGF